MSKEYEFFEREREAHNVLKKFLRRSRFRTPAGTPVESYTIFKEYREGTYIYVLGLVDHWNVYLLYYHTGINVWNIHIAQISEQLAEYKGKA